MGDKQRWPFAEANAVATELLIALRDSCARAVVAGSIRRERPDVGDIEILYISKIAEATWPGELIPRPGHIAELEIEDLVRRGVLARRPLKNGRTAFGAVNKLMVHVASGIPVDLFSTTEGCWWNYLVCRTGGAVSNMRIATAAKAKGLKWTPYGPGFEVICGHGMRRLEMVSSEQDVFRIAGLPYLQPWERE